eukprot:7714369-Pyramimonas_sp.AAC.5
MQPYTYPWLWCRVAFRRQGFGITQRVIKKNYATLQSRCASYSAACVERFRPPASDWSIVRIYPHRLRLIGPP